MMMAMAGLAAAAVYSCPDPSLSKLPPRLPPSSNLKPRATKVAAQTSIGRFNLDCSSKLRSQDLWEDPDRCGDSFDDDDGDDEGGEGGTAGTSASENDELVKEVEHLLSPEQRAIFQENKTPVLSKISTMKWSPFHTLTLAGQIPYMDQMIEIGTDIDSVDKDGLTALHRAVMGKKEAVISHLLRKGANPLVKDRVRAFLLSGLHPVCILYKEVFFVKQQFFLRVKDSKEISLMGSTYDNGTTRGLSTTDGATPLHYAVQVGAMQTVKLLIKYGVDVNIADKEGWTPLHVAMQSRSRDIAKVLLVNGADKTRKNKDGKIPLDLSLCYGKDFKSYDLAKLLKLVPANRDL